MTNQASLISALSKKSSNAVPKLSDENHPLSRQNSQLIDENKELHREVRNLKEFIDSLKSKNINNQVANDNALLLEKENGEIKALNEQLLKDNKMLRDLTSQLGTKVKNLESGSISVSNSDLHTLMHELNLSSNARKFYKAILDLTDGNSWTIISSKTLKLDYRVHSAYFSNARLELKDHGLVNFKEDFEKGTKRPVTKYKNLKG